MLSSLVGDRKLLVRVDRMELSKNVLRGFWAYDELLENRADLRGRVVFAAKLYPSRQGVPEYLGYAHEVEALAAAFDMDASERAVRATGLLAAAEARTPLDWFDDLLDAGDGGGRRGGGALGASGCI